MELEAASRDALAKAIRTARENAGLTQQQLADLAGLDQAKVSRYERALNVPPLGSLLAIDEACRQPRGTVLRLAELIDNPDSAEDAITSDPALHPDAAQALLTFYRLASTVTAGKPAKPSRAELVDDLRADADKPVSRPRRTRPAAGQKAPKRAG